VAARRRALPRIGQRAVRLATVLPAALRRSPRGDLVRLKSPGRSEPQARSELQLSPGQWHERVAERRTRRAADVARVDESGILRIGDVEALDEKRSVHARADAETLFGAQVEVEGRRSCELIPCRAGRPAREDAVAVVVGG